MRLGECYTFLKQAGRGTYGTTWIAEDVMTGKRVIIKDISKNNTGRSDFERELKYAKYLSKHPNIITTHDTAYETKTSYVTVQDYASGGDLFDAIQPQVGLKESTAKKYLKQICRAVEYMHSKNLVHRDIKPENIVIADKEGSSVQLIDFGMTLEVGTHAPRVCCSIPYTPPEICNAPEGFLVDPSCDVWSVGILLFCMLTGIFPWEQATLCDPDYYEFVQWQCGATNKPPRAWQKFSSKLLTLFEKMLAMYPKDRCSITEVYKYLNDSWLNTTYNAFEIYSHVSEISPSSTIATNRMPGSGELDRQLHAVASAQGPTLLPQHHAPRVAKLLTLGGVGVCWIADLFLLLTRNVLRNNG